MPQGAFLYVRFVGVLVPVMCSKYELLSVKFVVLATLMPPIGTQIPPVSRAEQSYVPALVSEANIWNCPAGRSVVIWKLRENEPSDVIVHVLAGETKAVSVPDTRPSKRIVFPAAVVLARSSVPICPVMVIVIGDEDAIVPEGVIVSIVVLAVTIGFVPDVV